MGRGKEENLNSGTMESREIRSSEAATRHGHGHDNWLSAEGGPNNENRLF
jgi:hypothetical protein